jgi:hypothetical protein
VIEYDEYRESDKSSEFMMVGIRAFDLCNTTLIEVNVMFGSTFDGCGTLDAPYTLPQLTIDAG